MNTGSKLKSVLTCFGVSFITLLFQPRFPVYYWAAHDERSFYWGLWRYSPWKFLKEARLEFSLLKKVDNSEEGSLLVQDGSGWRTTLVEKSFLGIWKTNLCFKVTRSRNKPAVFLLIVVFLTTCFSVSLGLLVNCWLWAWGIFWVNICQSPDFGWRLLPGVQQSIGILGHRANG